MVATSPSFAVIVVVSIAQELSADLAARVVYSMNVDVDQTLSRRKKQSRDITDGSPHSRRGAISPGKIRVSHRTFEVSGSKISGVTIRRTRVNNPENNRSVFTR